MSGPPADDPLPSTRDEVEAFLTALPQLPAETFREDVGLAASAALLARLGDPQDAIASVHVAGTAGKGTVATAIAAALAPHGRIGLHVSPHVYDLGERFQVDGRVPTDAEVVALARSVVPALREHARGPYGSPTYFEATCALAFTRFAQERCDLNVIEVGLGGLLDTTNTIHRSDKLAVITRLGLDHTQILGSTIAEIAYQKAGILPVDGDAVVLRPEDPVAWAVVQGVAAERRCRLHVVEPPDPGDGPTPHLAEDDLLVRSAVDVLRGRDERWRNAVAPELASLPLPGRFERLALPSGEVLLDGAHNPLKLEALLERVEATWPGRTLPWVFGCKGDKEADGMLQLLATRASALCVVGFDVPAGDAPPGPSRPADELARMATALAPELPLHVAASLDDAGSWAAAALAPDRPVAITGSFHLLRPVRARLATAGSTGP